MKIYVTTNWWSQIKTAGAAIYANRHYLKLFRQTNPSRLKFFDNCNGNSGGDLQNKNQNPEIIGDVFIHPSANIHPTAVVSIFFKKSRYIFYLCSYFKIAFPSKSHKSVTKSKQKYVCIYKSCVTPVPHLI